MTILFPSSDNLRPSFLQSLERPGNEYRALTEIAILTQKKQHNFPGYENIQTTK